MLLVTTTATSSSISILLSIAVGENPRSSISLVDEVGELVRGGSEEGEIRVSVMLLSEENEGSVVFGGSCVSITTLGAEQLYKK